MTLQEMIRALDELTPEEQNELRRALDQRAIQKVLPKDKKALIDADAIFDGETKDQSAEMIETMNASDNHHNTPLNMESIRRLFAELREGFTPSDLDELEWAMNLEVVKPLDENA